MARRKFGDPLPEIIEDVDTRKDFWVISNQDGEVKSCPIESEGYMEPEDILMEYKEQHELQAGEELIVYKVDTEIEQEELAEGMRQAIMNSVPAPAGEPITKPYIPHKDSDFTKRKLECKTDKGKVRKKIKGKWEDIDVEAKARIPGSFLNMLRKRRRS